MNRTNNTTLVVAFVVVIVLFFVLGGGAMTGGMMNGNMHGNVWTDERGWMWFPALIMLVVGVMLGWIIFKKRD